MREIKFRAWDKETKKMSYGNIEHFDDMLGFRFEHFETDEPIFMQFTGLKDKNGREIYEGDIVRSTMQKNDEDFEFSVIGTVTYFTSYAQFLLKTESGHPQLGFDLFEFDETEVYQVLETEVIGNIYENPGLLEGTE